MPDAARDKPGGPERFNRCDEHGLQTVEKETCFVCGGPTRRMKVVPDDGPRIIHRRDVRRYAQAMCQVDCGPPNTPPGLIEPCRQHEIEAWAIAGLRMMDGTEVPGMTEALSTDNLVQFPAEGSLDRFLIEARRLLDTAFATENPDHKVAISVAQLRMVVEALGTFPPGVKEAKS